MGAGYREIPGPFLLCLPLPMDRSPSAVGAGMRWNSKGKVGMGMG